MNTKTYTYGNGDRYEIRPLNKRLEAQCAGELSKQNLSFTIQNAPLEATIELCILHAKRTAVSMTKKDSTSPISRDELDKLIETYDALCTWITTKGHEFQADLDKEFAAEVKN